MTVYVVCRSKSGQTRGDWAVKKENGRYVSSHRLKRVAVKKARQVSRKGESVKAQNRHGKFQSI